jgi:hypothetical protein
MSEHRATPEQWARCESDARTWSGAFNCILELRARVEELEAAANYPAKPDSSPVSAEQEARNLLERMGVEGAQNLTASDLTELGNLISNQSRLLAKQTAPATAGSLALPGFSLDEFVLGVRRIQSALAPVVELHTRIEAARAEQAAPVPAGSLVERVDRAMWSVDSEYAPSARAAICEVAAQIRANVSPGPSIAAGIALWLEQEADRG